MSTAFSELPVQLKWIIICVCVIATLTSVIAVLETGSFNIIGLLMTYAFSYLLYLGRNWARWLTAILWAIAGLVALLSTLGTLELEQGMVFAAFSAILGVALLGSSGLLLFSPSIKSHFRKNPR